MISLLFPFLVLTVMVSSSRLVVLKPLDAQYPLIARVGQPFSWSFSPGSFGPSDEELKYSTSTLPTWLAFDPTTLNFHGTPSTVDVGNPSITVKAEDSSASVSSDFTLCVTDSPQPNITLPISEQFIQSNPSLSSVFLLAPNSALRTPNPALRVPHNWSFSIGFDSDTYTSGNDIPHYEVRQHDGSTLPEWMFFNPKAITLNGVAPSMNTLPKSTTINLCLFVSDQGGYTALSLPFDLVIASRELSAETSSLPTINVTASNLLNLSLSSPADFQGLLVDSKALQPSDIKTLFIDTSKCGGWLTYNNETRTLSGTPDSNALLQNKNSPSLPVSLTTTFDQTIQTKVSLAIVPSYFSASILPPLQVELGSSIDRSLVQEFSNATDHDDVNLTAAFEPAEAGNWVNLDSKAGRLAGKVPASTGFTHVTVTLTAYSRITHTTSHASLSISIRTSERKNLGRGGLSAVAHAKLVLGLEIAFGVVGGLCFIGGVLALFRHCARIEDTAIGGEEGRNVWSEQDKKWYGIGSVRNQDEKQGYKLGWSNHDPGMIEPSRNAMELPNSHDITQARGTPDYGNLGLGLRRVSERSQSNAPLHDSSGGSQNPGVMSKREFVARIKETVRIVSDKAHGRKPSRKRPVISKPIIRTSHRVEGLPVNNEADIVVTNPPSNPFDEVEIRSHPGSTIMTNSPSTSTAEHSIPRRRADFAPPRSPALVHFVEARLSRQFSTGSTGSLASNASARTHAVEAVVHTAAKATSIRSGRSVSRLSRQPPVPDLPEPSESIGPRPRLVPFTSATRVPVPRPPSLEHGDNGSPSPNKRIASQTAKVWKSNSANNSSTGSMRKSGSGDELKMGLHYVQSLGADHRMEPDAPTSDANNIGSATSESLQKHHDSKDMVRVSVKIGEKFKFSVHIPPTSSPSSNVRRVEIKLVSGKPLPKFLHTNMSVLKSQGTVEFYGAPAARDKGEIVAGVYSSDGVRIKRVVIEVVARD